LVRHYDQNELAIAAASELVRKNPNSVNARLVLISALVAEGRWRGAQNHVANLMTANPQFSLSRYAKQQPYEDMDLLQTQLAELRKVGLPD
jgi:protein involved in temperature-dependent protein secretion